MGRSRAESITSALVKDGSATASAYGQLGISEALRRFTEEFPYERGPILEFVIQTSRSIPPDAAVLDLGAGDAPYRELFAHTRYTTSDWTGSLHTGSRGADVIAPADALPIADGSYDVILCTQVIEHVPDPAAVLAECFRVLVPGGCLALTAPLLWELHEVPHDYYRYTEMGLRHLLASTGFVQLDVQPRSDAFTALAQLMLNVGWAIGDAPDGLSEHRAQARDLLARIAGEIAALAPLDVARAMPLGYSALARKP